MKTTFKPVLLAVSTAAVLSACNLAPKYQQPKVDLPAEQFRYDARDNGVRAAAVGWQDYFADPRLHRLIEIALKNNTDLRTASLNAEQVRTQYAIARADRFPGLNGNGSATRSGNANGAGNAFSAGLGIASFELDLWGRVRNTSQAALQSYFASTAARDATHLSLISSVAKAHFNEIYAEDAMKLAQNVLDSQQETYRLAKLRHKAGVISAIDLREQETVIENAKASYAAAVRAREQARNALELLIAQKLPDDLPRALPLAQQFNIRNLPAGLSSEVLLNRPDIRAAEHNLRQANANIGAARAAFFPTIGLTGNAGFSSSELSNLFESGSRNWSIGGVISVPIFNWGKTKANLDAAKVAQEKTVVAYEAAVRSAFRDVADALVARAALNSQYQANSAQAKAQAERLRLIRLRYKHGVSSSLNLLDAQRGSYSADSTLLSTRLNMAENLADLYKVLGGGLKRYTQDDEQVRAQLKAVDAARAAENGSSASAPQQQ